MNLAKQAGEIVRRAGNRLVVLTLDELVRLQRVLVEDTRFVQPGLRTECVFMEDRGPDGELLPEFIGARPEDLEALLGSLIEADRRMTQDGVDPVLQAAATAFGRLHRCLIHHVLAQRGCTPKGMIFPVSAVMLDEIEAYGELLRRHSSPLMSPWR